MWYVPRFFTVREMVCPHVYNRWQLNERLIWSFFDPTLLKTLDFIRESLDKPITVNNWSDCGSFTQRGLRCNLCPLVKEKSQNGTVYVSSHILGKAADFDVKGMSAEEVRQWLINNKEKLPFQICVEEGVNWVHIDMRQLGTDNIYMFRG